jgi:hypothetical protein
MSKRICSPIDFVEECVSKSIINQTRVALISMGERLSRIPRRSGLMARHAAVDVALLWAWRTDLESAQAHPQHKHAQNNPGQASSKAQQHHDTAELCVGVECQAQNTGCLERIDE